MIVDSTFFITCRQAPRLLEPVDHPLYPFPCAVDSPVKRPFPARVVLPRDGNPDAVLPAIMPDLATAVPLVADDTAGTALWAPAPRPLDSPLVHQVGEERGLMPMPRRQDACHELAAAFSPDVDFRTEAALTPAEGFGICATGVCACRMLMRPDDGAIDVVGVPIELACTISLLLDGCQKTSPQTGLPPAIKPTGDGAPWAKPLWQITPGGPVRRSQRIPLRMRRWSAAGRPVFGF